MILSKITLKISGIILMYTCCSCAQNYTTVIESQGLIWNCKSIENNSVDLNEFAGIKSIIGLDETDQSMVGSINKLIHEDSLFIIMDNDISKKVFVFDSNGKFLSSIGNSGSGPNEYLQLNDISYNSSDRLIYLLCDYKKILCYNLDGKLQKKSETPFRMINMEVFGDKYYFVSEDPTAYEAIICDNNLNVLSKYFANNKKKPGHRLVHALHKTSSDGVTFLRYLDNNIYSLTNSTADSISVKYTVDFGDNKIDRTIFENQDKNSLKTEIADKRGHIKYFSETEDYASIVYFDRNIPCISFFNRNTGVSKNFYIQNVSEDIVGTIYSPLEYSNGNEFLQVVYDSSYSKYRNNTTSESGENPLIIRLGK